MTGVTFATRRLRMKGREKKEGPKKTKNRARGPVFRFQ